MSTPANKKENNDPGITTPSIVLSDKHSRVVVCVNDILWLQAVKNYTIYHLRGGIQFAVSKHLKIACAELPSSVFCRIHRSVAVNLNEIDHYLNARGGKVILRDRSVLDVSQRNKSDFLSALAALQNS